MKNWKIVKTKEKGKDIEKIFDENGEEIMPALPKRKIEMAEDYIMFLDPSDFKYFVDYNKQIIKINKEIAYKLKDKLGKIYYYSPVTGEVWRITNYKKIKITTEDL